VNKWQSFSSAIAAIIMLASAVFRVAGTAAFMAYGLGNLSNGIWKGQPWGMTLKEAPTASSMAC